MEATLARTRVPRVVPASVVLAWATALAVHASGHAHDLHHDSLLGSRRPAPVALAAYLGVWVVMVIAMMLPSAIPLLRLFAGASANQPRATWTLTAFVAGYVALWALFGWLALAVDETIHKIVDAAPWLADRPWLIAAALLGTTGAFQFSSLKERCLDKCRHPAAYLLRYYRRGPRAAFVLGWGHGLFCLGCCWALMLLMFAAGVADLRWMAALTALMTYEKTGRRGKALASIAGIVLLGLAVLVAIHAVWVPPN